MIRREIGHMSIALAMVSALLLFAISEALAAPQAQQAAVVMTDNSFNPQSLTVTVGTTVTWTDNGNNPHTATSDTGAFDSGTLSKGQTFSFAFNTAGTFPYHCNFHQAGGMVGAITVQAPAATTSPAPAATPTAAAPAATPTTAPPVATPPPAAATAPAAAPTLKILAPAEGQSTGPDVTVQVQIANLALAPDAIGKANVPGQGHWHILLDGKLVQPVGTESFTLAGLALGPHAIKVELHNNDHSPLSPPVEATVNITVAGAPATPGLPKTGDSDLVSPWIMLVAAFLVTAGLAVQIHLRKTSRTQIIVRNRNG